MAPAAACQHRQSIVGSPHLTKLVAALSLVFILQLAAQQIVTMWSDKRSKLVLAFASVSGTAALAQDVDLSWHAPSQSQLNNLTQVLSGSGVYGFIYNTSVTPDEKYGTYNWCNMPHARAKEYKKPGDEYQLKYVELVGPSLFLSLSLTLSPSLPPSFPPLSPSVSVSEPLPQTNLSQIHRHHKRTPYSSNSFPVESYRWNCDDQGLYFYGQPFSSANKAADSYWQEFISPINPFVPSGWVGTCQFPQITASGLDDSWQHGADLYALYHGLLGFLPGRDEDWRGKVTYRVTTNVITSQVAGMVINGMWGTTDSVPLAVQASAVDSLEPTYGCGTASNLFNNIKSSNNPAWADHLEGRVRPLRHAGRHLWRQPQRRWLPCQLRPLLRQPERASVPRQAPAVQACQRREQHHLRDAGPHRRGLPLRPLGVQPDLP